MKKIKLISFLVFVNLCFTSLYAQTNGLAGNFLREQHTGDWVLGFGVNIVEDGGSGDFSEIFDKSSSHFSNPFILSAEYYTNNHFSFNTSLSFNKYLTGKSVDSGIIPEGAEPIYMALDVSSKYSFRELLKSESFEPYVLLGAGYTNIGSHTSSFDGRLTQIPSIGRMTVNGGFGANYWFSEKWGLNLNFLAKQGVKSGKYKAYITGQTQFSISALYRFKKK